MSGGGWVKLWRTILDSDVFANADLLRLFLWCLLNAGHTEHTVSMRTGRGETLITVGRGQFLYGRKTAARELGWAESTLYERMQKLVAMECIGIQAGAHFSIVTLANWDLYQESDDASRQANRHPNGAQPTGKQQASDTTKKGEKGKKGENVNNGEKDEAGRDDLSSWGVIGGSVRELAAKIAKIVHVKPSDRTNDRSLILKACYLVKGGKMPENWLWDAVEAVKQGESKGNKAAYFHACLDEGARELGQDFNRLLVKCKGLIPAEVIAGNSGSERQVTP